MSKLAEILAQRINASGPMTIADYMAECLLHPEYGYYTTRDPLGAGGDFTTAPEISQMFGELVGLSLAQSWLDQGAPASFTLAELGPGRGTLMADLLRATRAVPGFHDAMNICLVEASPALRVRQQDAIDLPVSWLENVGDLPHTPLFLIANEFFDALPIRQFERAENGWRERLITLAEDGTLSMALGAETSQAALTERHEDTRPGDIVETCPALAPIVSEIGERIAQHGGAALIVDYGEWRSLGDTLQALKAHEPADVLSDPGETDLTAHVDFEALAQASPCPYSRVTPQGVFLERLGITQRAQALAQRMTGAALTTHIAAHRRLTHPVEMGNLFKVLALYPKGAMPPPGCEP